MSILAIISMKARQNENEKNKKSKRIDKFLFFRIQCCIVFFFLSSYWNTILSFIFLLLLQTKWLYLNPKKNLKQRYISEKQIDKNCQFHSKKQTKKCIFENKRRMLLNVTFFSFLFLWSSYFNHFNIILLEIVSIFSIFFWGGEFEFQFRNLIVVVVLAKTKKNILTELM